MLTLAALACVIWSDDFSANRDLTTESCVNDTDEGEALAHVNNFEYQATGRNFAETTFDRLL